jgi:alpha-ribazole phosphatase
MLVRHTEVGVDAGVVYGRTDVPLADTFETERVEVAARIARFWPDGPTSIVASPATRARRLAEHLHETTGAMQPFTFDDRLLEIGFGAWEMQRWNDLDRSALDAWMADYVQVRPPHGDLPGENLTDLAARVGGAIDDAIAAGSEHTLVVCHGAVIRVALALLLHMPLSKSFSLEIDKGSVSRIGFRGVGEHRRPLILGVNYR